MLDVERAGAGEAGRAHQGDLLVGTNALSSTVSWLWVARIPSVSHVSMIWIAGGVAGQEAVHDLRVLRVGGVHGVEAAVASTPGSGCRRSCGPRSPSRRRPGSAVRDGEQQRDVVAGLAVQARRRPRRRAAFSSIHRQRVVAAAQQVGGHARSSSSACSPPGRWPARRRRAAAAASSTRRGRGRLPPNSVGTVASR